MTLPTSRTAMDQLAHLADCCHPDDLPRLKLDLVIYGACYLNADGRRVDPVAAPPVPARPLTEATPDQLTGVTGWRLEER